MSAPTLDPRAVAAAMAARAAELRGPDGDLLRDGAAELRRALDALDALTAPGDESGFDRLLDIPLPAKVRLGGIAFGPGVSLLTVLGAALRWWHALAEVHRRRLDCVGHRRVLLEAAQKAQRAAERVEEVLASKASPQARADAFYAETDARQRFSLLATPEAVIAAFDAEALGRVLLSRGTPSRPA